MSGEPKYPDVTVQLSGEDGNALLIVSRVRRALQRAGVESAELTNFSNEALSGDYDHVLQTCMAWVNVE